MKKKSMRSREVDTYMNTTIVGERGQVVIPKELRESMHLHPGSRVVFMQPHPTAPLFLFPLEHMRDYIDKMTSQFANLLQ